MTSTMASLYETMNPDTATWYAKKPEKKRVKFLGLVTVFRNNFVYGWSGIRGPRSKYVMKCIMADMKGEMDRRRNRTHTSAEIVEYQDRIDMILDKYSALGQIDGGTCMLQRHLDTYKLIITIKVLDEKPARFSIIVGAHD